MVIKVDFGRVFPGLIVLFVGLGLFVLWLILAIVSFFLFFIPGLQGVFAIVLNILLASVVLMGTGALVILTAVSGWGGREGWFGRIASKQAFRDQMRASERAGALVGLIFSLFVLLFFFENQVRGTGFFTSNFRLPEQILFYGTALFGAGVRIARALYGRRNTVRPLKALQGAVLTTSYFWFLAVFPFDFAHFPDLLPGLVQPAFFWLTNQVGALLLALGGIGGLGSLVYNSVLYSAVRSRMASGTAGPKLD